VPVHIVAYKSKQRNEKWHSHLFKKLKWLKEESFKKIYTEAEEINKMLSGLINSITS
jgi:four helix bundle protein